MQKTKNFLSNLLLTLKYFHSPKEIFILVFFVFLAFFTFISVFLSVSNYFKVDRIIYKGNINEGIIGIPKVTDPFQAINQAEKNLAKLLFSSLIKNVKNENDFTLSLAEKIEISNDKKEYKIYVKNDARFSNSEPILSQDIIYSLSKIPLEKNFTTEIIDERTLLVKFDKQKTDKQNNLEIFTYPIIQKGENFESNYSNSLVTSSFFRIQDIVQDDEGNITSIELNRFDNGENKLPYIKKYKLSFYTDEAQSLADFQAKEINLLSGISGQIISKLKDDKSFKIINSELSNNFALFINQNQDEELRDVEFRKFLSESIDRDSLVNQVLGGYAIPQKNILGNNTAYKSTDVLLKKLPPGLKLINGVLYRSIKTDNTDKSADENGKAIKVSITTINNKELVETAQFVANSWKKLGIETEIKAIDRSELQRVVKDRDFDILLFGFSIKSAGDYYSFFHSKERAYPKLNIANYTRKKTDIILENLLDVKTAVADLKNEDLVKDLSVELENDMPIILLYKPLFVQAISGKLTIQEMKNIYTEVDKYENVQNWFTEQEKVLRFFENINFLKTMSMKLDTKLN